MASKSNGSARTAPKGQATPRQGASGDTGSRLGTTTQWVLVILLIAAVLGAIMYLLRDENADVHSGADLGVGAAPAVVVGTGADG